MTGAASSHWLIGDGEMVRRVRGHDWSATPLGSIDTWPVELRTGVAIVLDATLPAVLTWGEARAAIFNDALLPSVRGGAEMVGRAYSELRVPAGETLARWVDGLRRRTGGGPSRSPLRDADGAVLGHILFVPADCFADPLASSGSEVRSRTLIEGIAQAVWETDAEGRMVIDSPSTRRYTGQTLEELLGSGWLDAIHPDDRDVAEQHWREAVARGQAVDVECRIHHAGSRDWRWTNVRAVPIRAPDGSAERWVGMSIDVHERRSVEEALRHSEERLRNITEIVQLGLWDWNIRTNQVIWSDEHYRMEGYEPGEVKPSYESWVQRLHPDDREGTEAALRAAQRSGEPFAHEFRSLHPDGTVRWMYGRGHFFYDSAGKPIRMVGAMVDTTERREAEQRQSVLLAELQHRVRNILTVIHSIIRRSHDGERSTDDYVQHLEGRLAALARTQVLLTRKAGIGVELEDIVRDELLVQVASERQFTLSGPPVSLSPKAAEVLTLAIHELATNATKYGAFSRRGGGLRVTWTVERRSDEDWLLLCWRETGVPVLDPAPRREGFGTELLVRRVPYELKGLGTLDLRPGGLESRIEFPLTFHDSILLTDRDRP